MNLNHPLIKFSPNSQDWWTLRDAVRGVQIFGGIGSGKTSGSGRTLAKSYLKNGFGGLVLCAKPDERENWEQLAVQMERRDDLIILGEDRGYYFNPLEYEATRQGVGGGETYNLVNLFMQIYQMGRIISGAGLGRESDRFWDNALKRCIGRMIDLLRLADEQVSVENMHLLLTTTLSSDEIGRFQNIWSDSDKDLMYKKLNKWAEYNYYVYCYTKANIKYNRLLKNNSEKLEDFGFTLSMVKNYFEREFVNLAEKTKTIIVESFLGIAEPFLGGILKKYFSNKTTITPEITYKEGKIIVLDFPIKKYLDAGVYAQGIFKLLWQQAIERRTFGRKNDIPVFLWVDESQMFLTSYDQVFQTTARSAGACTVFLTQNINNYIVAIGGNNAKARVNSLLGNLSTKIFHANNDYETNEWAANSIGKKFRKMTALNVGHNESANVSEQLHFQIEPATFSELKTGGVHKDSKLSKKVEGVLQVSGKIWSTGKNYIRLNFKQE